MANHGLERRIHVIFTVILSLCIPVNTFFGSFLANGAVNVIIMGLPRSGSLSLHSFFQCNGERSSHYCCGASTSKLSFPCDDVTCGSCVFQNMKKSAPAFQNCGNFQVYSQFDVESGDPFSWFLPQHFAMSYLHQSYPKATWILNTRKTPEAWADSVLHWYSVTRRLMNAFDLTYHKDIPQTVKSLTKDKSQADLYRDLDAAIERAQDPEEHKRRRAELAFKYNEHSQKVRDFAKKNQIQLIEVNVDDPRTGEHLVEAFPLYKSDCWKFDADEVDNDWKDFAMKL